MPLLDKLINKEDKPAAFTDDLKVSKTARGVPCLYYKKAKVNRRLSIVLEHLSFLPLAEF